MHGLALFEGVELHGTCADNLENDRNGAGFAVKPPAMVRGMRSESSFARTMINWPAFAFLAMSGAWIQSSVTVGFNSLRFTMVNIVLLTFAQNAVFLKKRIQTGDPNA